MRLKSLIAAIIAVCVLSLGVSNTASAFGWRHHECHSQSRHCPDPYAYRYEPRGYYPYYSSRYWRPARKVRRHRGFRAPRYYPAWGYKKRRYRHYSWHERNHGGHPFWQW